MPSRFTSHVVLIFLLLFGQFSSLAHALEHFSIPEHAEPCLIQGSHPSHQGESYLYCDASFQSHNHDDHSAKLKGFNSTTTLSVESSEPITCLIFHLHGGMQAGFTAEQGHAEVFAHLRNVCIWENAAVIPVFTALYDTRGPPAHID